MILRSENAIAEWTFAHLAFPEQPDNIKEFIRLLEERKSNFVNLSDPLGKLMEVRRIASRLTDKVAYEILNLNPKIVGCSSTFCQHVSSLALLRKIKELAPSVVTMMGGAHCDSIMGKTTHEVFGWVDYVVSGEAEGVIGDLTRKALDVGSDLLKDQVPPGVFAPCHRINGYPQCETNQKIFYPRATVKDFGSYPPPNYADYMKRLNDTPKVGSEIRTGILVESSRGCWWQRNDGCTFCGLNGAGREFRRKAAPQVLNELKLLNKSYGVNRFEMVDNVMDPAFMNSLIPELSRLGAPYDIFFEVRPGLGRADFQRLREAGVIWIQPGIESLHTKILKLINKGSESWQNVQILKWTSQLGIRCSWILMYDFPGEDDQWYEEMAEYLPSLFHLQAPRSLTRVRYVRFSHYHSDPGKFGLNLSPAKPFSLVYPLPEEVLKDLVFYFDEEEQLRFDKAPFISEFFLKRGFFNIKKIQEEWVREEESGKGPTLYLMPKNSGALIRDHRPIAGSNEYCLNPIQTSIYLMSDDAPTEKELFDKTRLEGYDINQVRDTLQYFIDNKLMLHLDNRYISLALKYPVTPLRPLEDFPGGALMPVSSKAD